MWKFSIYFLENFHHTPHTDLIPHFTANVMYVFKIWANLVMKLVSLAMYTNKFSISRKLCLLRMGVTLERRRNIWDRSSEQRSNFSFYLFHFELLGAKREWLIFSGCGLRRWTINEGKWLILRVLLYLGFEK